MMLQRYGFKCKKTKSQNFYRKLSQRQYSGKGLTIVQIPKECIKIEGKETANQLLSLIYDVTITSNDKHTFCYHVFWKEMQLIQTRLYGERDRQGLCQLVTEIGTVESLLDIVVQQSFTSNFVNGCEQPILKCRQEHMEHVSVVLSVVHECMLLSKTKFYYLRWNYKLVEALFSLLVHSTVHLRSLAANLLEEVLLGSAQPPILFKNINGISYMLSQVTGKLNEAPFYHILCAFLFHIEFNSVSSFTLNAYQQRLTDAASDIINKNQEFLLHQSNWFENMSKISSKVTLLQHDDHDDLTMAHLNVIFADILAVKKKSFFADLFHLIIQFLLGEHRDEVQQRLVNSNFFYNINNIMESVVWKEVDVVIYTIPPRNDEYTPDLFMKVQSLRLFHAVADDHINRYYLLSKKELEALKGDAKKEGLELHHALLDFKEHNMCDDDKGPMSFIINKFASEPGGSILKFWITRVMEAFLRGNAKPVDQMFFINKGLIERTIGELLAGSQTSDVSIQGSFDFLSMLMKFNMAAFKRCEEVLDCTAKFIQLVKQIEDNLVDSNMFLRCISLTNDRMKSEGLPGIAEVKKIRLLRHYLNPPKLVSLTGELVKLLSVPSLSQDNISCLNTAIMFLCFAHRDDMLSWYLHSLVELEDGEFILSNLKSLLQFWRIHYNPPKKARDRKSLELSTAINFSELQAVTNLLLADDNSSLCISWHQGATSEQNENQKT